MTWPDCVAFDGFLSPRSRGTVAKENVETVASEAVGRCCGSFLAFRDADVRDCTIWRRVVQYL